MFTRGYIIHIPLYNSQNVRKAIINHPYFDGVYLPFIPGLGMGYSSFTIINQTKYMLPISISHEIPYIYYKSNRIP
jgi:hypothetical protein